MMLGISPSSQDQVNGSSTGGAGVSGSITKGGLAGLDQNTAMILAGVAFLVAVLYLRRKG